MTKNNFDKYKFRCSELPTLLSNGRSKTELLSETAKSKLVEIWIKERYGREKYIESKYMEKGLFVEQDSLELATKVLNIGFIPKNKEKYHNDWICGTPDAVKPILIDVKSSWDIFTFASVTPEKAEKDYYWQLWGYGWLTGLTSAKLIYALTNTPEHITANELYRLSFKMDEEATEKYRNNFVYDDIPEVDRVKIFDIVFDTAEGEIDIMKNEKNYVIEKLTACREYLNQLSL